METLDHHNQTHNDIKPQNFLVKFKNGPNDLTQIEIVLTDFGMADSDSKGGTPIFASPECFEKKEKKSDIFSFGRVILFLLLTKNQFIKWLFVPIKDRNLALWKFVYAFPDLSLSLNMVLQMTSFLNRLTIRSARLLFNRIRLDSKIKLNNNLISAIQSIINNEISNDVDTYTSELCDFR